MYANNAACEILELDPNDQTSKSIDNILEKLGTEHFLKTYIKRILNQEKVKVRKDNFIVIEYKGNTLLFQLELKIIVNKNKTLGGLILILNSITEKKEIEENYRLKTRYLQIENQIATILNTTGQHNMICDVIRKEFNLHTVSLMLVHYLKEMITFSGISTILPEFVMEMTKSITIDMKSNKQIQNYFYGLQSGKVISLQELATLMLPEKEIDVSSSFITEFISQLNETQPGELLLLPMRNTAFKLNGIIIAFKQKNQQFIKEECNHLNLISNFINIAIDKQFKEEQIHKLAYYDELTNLTNIKFMKEQIEDKIRKEKIFALFSIKIRNFSKVISSRGDRIGDKAIIYLAEKITQSLVKYKNVILSRTSGIAFLCSVDDCNEAKAKEIVNNILYVFRKPFYLGGNIIHLFASIGIYLSTRNTNTEATLQKTNIALEKAREKAESIYQIKNNYVIYQEKMGQERIQQEEIRQELREDLATRKNFEVHYQPKIDINGFIKGYEAVVRWQRKDKLLLPGLFINQITEMGLSDHLFSIVLEIVCQDMDKIDNGHKEISINIAPEQFNDPLLIAKINKTFRNYRINPLTRDIKFEIIESELVNSKNLQMIKDIHSLGLKISVDDFGSGYSNLKTINELAKANLIDEIKIDKSLIDGITEDSTLLAIILEMARKLAIDVVAEGVETIYQYFVLRSLCSTVIIQGWLFAKALPLQKILKLEENSFREIINSHVEKI